MKMSNFHPVLRTLPLRYSVSAAWRKPSEGKDSFVIRLVLFDIDGTLVHTGGAGTRAFADAFAEAFELQGTETLRFAGRTDTSLVREFFLRHKVTPTPEHYRIFFERYLHHLQRWIVELPGGVFPGVTELIEAARRSPANPAIGLLTGNIRRGAEIKLRHFGIWEEFALGAFGDDHEERNELARIAVMRGAERMGRKLDGREVLVIGDTPLDVECGKAVNARVLAVATGQYSVDELNEHKPDWTLPTLASVGNWSGILGFPGG